MGFVKSNDSAGRSLMFQKDTQTYIEERTSTLWGNTRARKVYNGKTAGLNLLILTIKTEKENNHLICPVSPTCIQTFPLLLAGDFSLGFGHETLQGIQALI
jgi:hypothetical protein